MKYTFPCSIIHRTLGGGWGYFALKISMVVMNDESHLLAGVQLKLCNFESIQKMISQH